MKTFNQTNKAVTQLKEFESTLIDLRHTIRKVKHEYKKNTRNLTCAKLKDTYRQKFEIYALKEFNYMLNSVMKPNEPNQLTYEKSGTY